MNVDEKMRVIKTTLDKGYARNLQKTHYHVKKYFQGNKDDAITQNVLVNIKSIFIDHLIIEWISRQIKKVEIKI